MHEDNERDRATSKGKKKRLQSRLAESYEEEHQRDTIDEEYEHIYRLFREHILNDVKRLVREHVENISTTSASYEFMNVYGMCSFDPPNLTRVLHQREGSGTCVFTKLTPPQENDNSNCQRLITVSGKLNPLVSARVHHGELQLTRCSESDYQRSLEELTRLEARNNMRHPRITTTTLGTTIDSLENRFIFTVREDLHALGCAYRQILLTVELFHLLTLHYIHT